MRVSFEKIIADYNRVAKEKKVKEKEKGGGGGEEKDSELNPILDWLMKWAVQARESSSEAQKEIFAIQEKKQGIMERLRAELKGMAGSAERPEGARLIAREGEELFWGKDDGSREAVTLGEIITDGEWGIDYFLDPTVPRAMRKKFFVARAKNELLSLLDEQIIKDELASKRTDDFKKEAYGHILKSREEGQELSGLVAEKMVRNFLKRLCVDFKMPFKVMDVDVYQDVAQKIDFIIHRKFRNRGVLIGENNDIGIQFTISDSKQYLDKKNYQINREKRLDRELPVDDIVLVSIPIGQVMATHNIWKSSGMPPGGPEKLLDKDIKKKIFEGVMDKFLSSEEIKSCWDSIEARMG